VITLNKLKRLRWSNSEVLAYLEHKILNELADEDEIEFYEDCLWSGSINKYTYTYKNLIDEMREYYNNGDDY